MPPSFLVRAAVNSPDKVFVANTLLLIQSTPSRAVMPEDEGTYESRKSRYFAEPVASFLGENRKPCISIMP